jgi:multicomponent K+:H+ antiporter subunit D
LAVGVWSVVLLSSLGIIVALARAGSTVFWKAAPPNAMQAVAARGSAPERGALALLVIAALTVMFCAGPLARYADATARQLLERSAYMDAVLSAQPALPAWQPRANMQKAK